MSHTKAIIDFSGYSGAELIPLAQSIHDQMTANVAIFSTPAVPMTALQTQIDDTEAKFIARASNAKADIVAFNASRDALEQTLRVIGNYVNGIAQGDPAPVVQSGYPSYDTARAADYSPPAAPADLRLRHGEVSGSISALYKPDRQGSTNEMQVNTGDPNTEADWRTKGLFQGSRAVMDGFTPGTIVWVRVRTVGLKGVMGAWSDPAQIRVI